MATANSPRSMYTLKSYCDTSAPVNLPNCMYDLKPVYGDSNTTGEVAKQTHDMQQDVSSSSDGATLEALEKRQEAILHRLQELKVEVDKMGSIQTQQAQTVKSAPKSLSQTPQKLDLENGVLCDLVVSANPSSPPLSLLVLKDLLCQHYKVLLACHVHSSVKQVPDKLRTIFGSNGVPRDRTGYQLAFTLIWKDVQHGPSLMASAKLQTSLLGEGSIARHLARLLQHFYDNGADICQTTEVDNWVDMSYQLQHSNSKERQAIVRTMNGKLGKSQWLVGAQLSLADIVMWSALHQSQQHKGVAGNVKQWVERCNQQSIFSGALSLVDS